MQFQTRAKT